jgi:hypothetical protein
VSQAHNGELIAALLAFSWRPSAPPTELRQADLDAIEPLLNRSGAAGLAWWRLRGSSLGNAPSSALLQQAYRYQALQAEVHENGIRRLFRCFGERSIPAIVAKGWAVARHYPDMALRPYGDIDVLVAPQDFAAAQDITRSPELRPFFFDLHYRFVDLHGRSFEELHARSEVVTLGNDRISVLGVEDHLALLCMHFLRHGGYRPIWLCDIAATAEALPEKFNWDICFGSDHRTRSWILSALTLACTVLGARVSFPNKLDSHRVLPAWITRTVLREWSNDATERQPVPLRQRVRMGQSWRTIARVHWPNPIEASIRMDGKVGAMSQLPYQVLVACAQPFRSAYDLGAADDGATFASKAVLH